MAGNKANGGSHGGRAKKFMKNENDDAKKKDRSKSNKGNNSNSKGSIRITKPIGYIALEKCIAATDHSKLLLELSSNTFGFLTLLQQNTIQPGIMCLILSAFVKAVQSPADNESRKMVVYFLRKILPNDNFMGKTLPVFIMNLQKYTTPKFHEHEKYVQAIFDLLKFIQQVQLIMPQGSRDIITDIMPGIQAQIEFINRKGNCFDKATMDLLADVTSAVENFTTNEGATRTYEKSEDPPDDFRLIQICPDSQDILHNHEPFIRKNVVDGNYVGGVHHYLDIHFRLLREDFLKSFKMAHLIYHIIYTLNVSFYFEIGEY